MNPRLPKLLETIVGRLLPEAARVHVLGDLWERYEENGSALGYLTDVVTILPCVIGNYARRNLDSGFIALESIAILLSLVGGAQSMPGGIWQVPAQAILLAVPVALVTLRLGDAYVAPLHRTRIHILQLSALAYGAIWLVGAVCGGLAPWLAVLRPLAFHAAPLGAVLLLSMRLFRGLMQPVNTVLPPTSFEDVRRDAEQLRKKIRDRNVTEYLAFVAVAVFFAASLIFKASTLLQRAAFGVAIAGAIIVAYNLWRRTAPREIPPDLASHEYAARYRAELTRQRDALWAVPLWYIGPLIPGLALIMAARSGPGWLGKLIATGFLIGTGLLLVFLNRRAATHLQRKIDGLDEWEKQA